MNICLVVLALLAFLNFTKGQAVKKCGYGRTGPDCDECGKVFVNYGRIIDGEESMKNEWPSVVFIQFSYKFYDSFNTTRVRRLELNCTGTLINKRTVLTTSSCLYIYKETFQYENSDNKTETVVIEPNSFHPTIESMFKVYLGVNSIRKALLDKKNSAVKMDIESFKIHPKFNGKKFANDIGIIRLSSEVEYSKKIQPACLPNPKIKNYPIRQNIKLWAVGWGTTDLFDTYPDRLHKVMLNRYSFGRCKNVIKSFYKNPNTQMCVGFLGTSKDTCYGDSGAPLFKNEFIKGVHKFVIAGITSYGEECGQGFPSVFTKVSSYLDWIEKESVYRKSNSKRSTTTTMSPDGNLIADTICTENFNDGYCDACGKHVKQSRLGRIYGGRESMPFNWPSTVLISTTSDSEKYFFCGGTLINRDTVLTTSFCTFNQTVGDSIINVYLGAINMTLLDTTQRSAIKIITHPNFKQDGENLINNIAILKLSEPVELSESIQPACLPPNENYPGKFDVPVFSVGWGDINKESSEAEEFHGLQRYAELTLYESEKCSSWKEFNSTSQICAGDAEGKGPCDGDYGGPLFYIDSFDQEPRHVLNGIPSFGENCGQIDKHDLFTKVGYYLSWIRENML